MLVNEYDEIYGVKASKDKEAIELTCSSYGGWNTNHNKQKDNLILGIEEGIRWINVVQEEDNGDEKINYATT